VGAAIRYSSPRPPAPSSTTGSTRWTRLRFGLLEHDTSPDPLFVYANLTAQERFERSWDEFVGLPSRLSAGELAREERRVFLDQVRLRGYADDYRGVRIAKSG
jgi:hypothetical protein